MNQVRSFDSTNSLAVLPQPSHLSSSSTTLHTIYLVKTDAALPKTSRTDLSLEFTAPHFSLTFSFPQSYLCDTATPKDSNKRNFTQDIRIIPGQAPPGGTYATNPDKCYDPFRVARLSSPSIVSAEVTLYDIRDTIYKNAIQHYRGFCSSQLVGRFTCFVNGECTLDFNVFGTPESLSHATLKVSFEPLPGTTDSLPPTVKFVQSQRSEPSILHPCSVFAPPLPDDIKQRNPGSLNTMRLSQNLPGSLRASDLHFLPTLIQSKYVIKAFEYGIDSKQTQIAFLETELEDERLSLAKFMKPPVNIDDIERIFVCTLLGLNAMHKLLLIHGHICPDTIFHQTTADNPHPPRWKIGSLWNVTAVDRVTETTRRCPGDILTKFPRSHPPETIFRETESPASDIFQLGCLLLHLLLGFNPYLSYLTAAQLPSVTDGDNIVYYNNSLFGPTQSLPLDLISVPRAEDKRRNALFHLAQRLVSFAPNERPSASELLEEDKTVLSILKRFSDQFTPDELPKDPSLPQIARNRRLQFQCQIRSNTPNASHLSSQDSPQSDAEPVIRFATFSDVVPFTYNLPIPVYTAYLQADTLLNVSLTDDRISNPWQPYRTKRPPPPWLLHTVSDLMSGPESRQTFVASLVSARFRRDRSAQRVDAILLRSRIARFQRIKQARKESIPLIQTLFDLGIMGLDECTPPPAQPAAAAASTTPTPASPSSPLINLSSDEPCCELMQATAAGVFVFARDIITRGCWTRIFSFDSSPLCRNPTVAIGVCDVSATACFEQGQNPSLPSGKSFWWINSGDLCTGLKLDHKVPIPYESDNQGQSLYYS